MMTANAYVDGYEDGHEDGVLETLAEVKEEIARVDPVVLGAFVAWLGGIFVTDALFLKYRKPRNGAPTTYTGNTRKTRILQLFFWYLALHMTRRWRWDPLTRLSDHLERRKQT